MARELGKLYVGVRCANCGGHGEGIPTDDGRTRCGKCGKFGQELTQYCAEHDVDYGRMAYDECPACKEERRVREMEHEMMARRSDPRMHPTVDAPRW